MDTLKIKKIFEDTKKRVQGIRDILLVTDDGFPIVTTLDTGDEESLSTAVGAIISDAGQRGVKELSLGEINLSVVIGTDGYFVTKRLQQGAIIMTIVDNSDMAASLGLCLFRLRRMVPELMQAYES